MSERLTGRIENLDWVLEHSGAAYTLRLNRRRWEDIETDSLGRPILIVVGTWLLLAWARFGSHSISSPRALTRYVLVGVYGWIGLSVLFWLVGRIQTAPGSGTHGMVAAAIRVGQVHQPLAIGGLIIQIIQILPTGPVTGIIALASVSWMGGQLIGAMAAHQQRPVFSVAGPTMLAWLPWLATAGFYLWHRLGHLI
jgi:hypothetical protein